MDKCESDWIKVDQSESMKVRVECWLRWNKLDKVESRWTLVGLSWVKISREVLVLIGR